MATTNTRYALAVNSVGLSSSNLNFNGNAIYANGTVKVVPNTGAGQNTTTSVLISVNGTIQCYQVNQTGPSLRSLKQNIRDYNYEDLLVITPKTYEFNQQACSDMGIGYDDRQNINGFILDEVPAKYRHEDGVHLLRSQLETDLLYMLVQENKALKQRVTDLESKMALVLQTLNI